ncbi:MAG: hypothetical protein ACRDNP_02780 [Gaiellaceae bacterium]
MQRTTTRELAHRASDGVEVWLRWNPEKNRLTVVVEDAKVEKRFELQARADNALEVFYHPFAYAPGPLSAAAAFAA